MRVDLYMEHTNHTLKDYLKGLGANVSQATIIFQMSKNLMEVTSHFDSICDIHQRAHTYKCYGQDLDIVLEELTVRSRMFDYVPGHFHWSFKDIKSHIREHVDLDSLFQWIKKHQVQASSQMKLETSLSPKKAQ